ncbi:MAG: hypothetical protein WD768_10830 [Phycisphaeraceae bacterium]
MPSTTSAMITALDAFEADSTDAATVSALYGLTEEFDTLANEDKAQVIPAMFRLMERWPEADLGSPGPLVHSIESLGVPMYEALLVESVRRQPMYLNLWMVNRILNTAPAGPRRTALLALLLDVRADPKWAGLPSDVATGFLKYPSERAAD